MNDQKPKTILDMFFTTFFVGWVLLFIVNIFALVLCVIYGIVWAVVRDELKDRYYHSVCGLYGLVNPSEIPPITNKCREFGASISEISNKITLALDLFKFSALAILLLLAVAILGVIIYATYTYLFVDDQCFKQIDISDLNLAKLANSRYGDDLSKVNEEYRRLLSLSDEEKRSEVKKSLR